MGEDKNSAQLSLLYCFTSKLDIRMFYSIQADVYIRFLLAKPIYRS